MKNRNAREKEGNDILQIINRFIKNIKSIPGLISR